MGDNDSSLNRDIPSVMRAQVKKMVHRQWIFITPHIIPVNDEDKGIVKKLITYDDRWLICFEDIRSTKELKQKPKVIRKLSGVVGKAKKNP